MFLAATLMSLVLFAFAGVAPLVELHGGATASRAFSFANVQYTNGYVLYARHQFGPFAGRSYPMKGFRSLDDCLRSTRLGGLGEGVIVVCEPARAKVHDNFVPLNVARACALPAMHLLSTRVVTKGVTTPSKIIFAYIYDYSEMPRTAESRAAAALRLSAKDIGSLDVVLFLTGDNNCEAHIEGKTYSLRSNTRLKAPQVQAEIAKVVAKF